MNTQLLRQALHLLKQAYLEEEEGVEMLRDSLANDGTNIPTRKRYLQLLAESGRSQNILPAVSHPPPNIYAQDDDLLGGISILSKLSGLGYDGRRNMPTGVKRPTPPTAEGLRPVFRTLRDARKVGADHSVKGAI